MLYAQVQLAIQKIAPACLSTAGVLRVFRRLLRDYLHPLERGQSLPASLRRAVRDAYPRQNKTSRNYPRKKRPDPPAGPPEVLLATRAQIARAHRLQANLQKGLAA